MYTLDNTSGLPLVREKSGKFKVREKSEFCPGSGKFEILRKVGETGKSLESQGNLTFSCHTRNAANSNSLCVTSDHETMFIPQTYAVKNVDTIRSSVGCCNNAITVLLAILTYIYIGLTVQQSEWASNTDYIL